MEKPRAEFAITDDILREALQERLANLGAIVIERSGRIGPIVELMLASLQFKDQYKSVRIDSEFSTSLWRALQSGIPFGGDYQDVIGAFPLGIENPITAAKGSWDQWAMHAQNIAKTKGLNEQLVKSLMGALFELQDNVYEHSDAPQTGLVAYAVTKNSFEFVVADRGQGVLQTLRRNPCYAGTPDSGAALQEVIKDGVSRFPSEHGRGQGFNQLFRALVGHNAELRFRSGDHALTMRPTPDILHGKTILAQVPTLNGLMISVFHSVHSS